jgi:hypothetical protein
MDLRKTTVTTVPSGDMHVEIAIGDALDKEGAEVGIRFAVVIPRMGENPTLSEIQTAAMNHVRRELDACIQSLRPKA